MDLAISTLHDFLIKEASFEVTAWLGTDGPRDDVSLTLTLASSAYNDDPRKLTGEVRLSYAQTLDDAPLLQGSWVFYEPNRFDAEIRVTESIVTRIWNNFSAKPDFLIFNLWEAPEPSELGLHYEGQFRIGCRAWGVRNDKQGW